MLVADAAFPAFQHYLTAVLPGHIGDHLAAGRVLDDRAFRHFQDNILSVLSMAVPLAALFTILRFVFAPVAVICQCIQTFVHFKDDVAASSAVASVRTAVRDKQFSAEAYVAVAAFS